MSTQVGTFYVGTYGYPIEIDMETSLADATAVHIDIVKPGGDVIEHDLNLASITDEDAGIVQYVPADGETDEAGVYEFTLSVDAAGKHLVTEGEYTLVTRAAGVELEVEDGTGKDDANSYASLEEADAYHASNLNGGEWTAASNDKRAAALVMATRVLDSKMDWFGFRTTAEQALDWPRSRVRNDLYAYSAGLASALSGYYYNATQIPKALKDAAAQQALELIKDPSRIDDAGERGVSSIGLGSGAMDLEFDKADRITAVSDQVVDLLKNLGRYRGGATGGIVRVRRM